MSRGKRSRDLSEWQKFCQKHRLEGKSFAEISALWKQQKAREGAATRAGAGGCPPQETPEQTKANVPEVGRSTVEWLFREQLRVDREWAVATTHGFRWWAYRHAQVVEALPAGEASDDQALVSVRTDLLRSVSLTDSQLSLLNKSLMWYASMAGPVYDPEHGTICLASLVRVSEDISGWMNRLISVAAVLQLGEARRLAASLARELGAEEAESGPPGRGLREEPDEMAYVVEALILPHGQQAPRWRAEEFQDVVDRFMQGPPALLATSGGPGFTVEFPYGDESSLCEARGDDPHPRYGNGLSIRQSFPVSVASESEGIRLALELNRKELVEEPFGYGFGSYSYRRGIVYFTSFFPNLVYQRGLLTNLYFSCGVRAFRMSVMLTGKPWTPESFSPERSSLGSLLRDLRES